MAKKKKPAEKEAQDTALPEEPTVPTVEGGFDPDGPRYGLPPDVTITEVITPLAEVIDWSGKFLKLPELWLKHSGKGTLVCVLDTGCDLDHPDLKGKIVDAKDFTNSRYGPYDRNDHGTWCCGCISANADDNGIRGVAYESKLLVAKVLGDQGSGYDSWIMSGMTWGFDKGADVFSLSLGGGRMSETLHREFLRIAAAGKFIICAAGNDAGPINYPAAWADACLSVGACDEQGRLTRFTSRGPTLGIVAPGQNMISTIPVRPGGGAYGSMTGTSMATPLVAAITCLALAKHRLEKSQTPLENITQLRDTFKRTASPMPEGYGLVDPSKLLAAIQGGMVPGVEKYFDLPMPYNPFGVTKVRFYWASAGQGGQAIDTIASVVG